MELQLCLDTLIAHFRLYLVVLVLGSFRCLCARSAGGRILRSDWQSRWIEFVDGVSGDLAGFILHDSAPEQGLMRCLARCRGPLNKHNQILAETSDQGAEAELELHLATPVQTASRNTAYSSSDTSRRDGKDGHLHCMDAHGLRVSAAFGLRRLHPVVL